MADVIDDIGPLPVEEEKKEVKISYDDVAAFAERERAGLASLVATDDGKLVMFKKQFDKDTGAEVAEEYTAVVTLEDLQAEVDLYQKKIDTLKQFMTDKGPLMPPIKVK